MSEIDDGGQAFPGVEGVAGYGGSYPIILPDGRIEWMQTAPGMSLRDYFAIKASEEDMKLYLKNGEYNFFRSMYERTAARYAFADAMIAQRKER